MKTVYQVSDLEIRKLVVEYIVREAGLCYLDPTDVEFDMTTGRLLAEVKEETNE